MLRTALALSLLALSAPALADTAAPVAAASAQAYDSRFVLLEGTRNFRDLGGLHTADGKTVKPGLFFRSGPLGSLTDQGKAAFARLQVTRIVEDAVATVGDVAHIMSTVSDGMSATTIEFSFGKDIDRAVNDVRDAVTRVRSDLPGSINEPVITRTTTSGGPMLTYTVKAAGKIQF